MSVKEIEKDKIIAQLKKVLAEEGDIIFAYLHGSFISSDKFNDIDCGVYINLLPSIHFDPLDFEFVLSLKIEKAVKFTVDIKLLNFAPLAFRYQVSRGRVIFSRDESKREDFLAKTWSEYFDLLPLYQTYLKEVLNVSV